MPGPSGAGPSASGPLTRSLSTPSPASGPSNGPGGVGFGPVSPGDGTNPLPGDLPNPFRGPGGALAIAHLVNESAATVLKSSMRDAPVKAIDGVVRSIQGVVHTASTLLIQAGPLPSGPNRGPMPGPSGAGPSGPGPLHPGAVGSIITSTKAFALATAMANVVKGAIAVAQALDDSSPSPDVDVIKSAISASSSAIVGAMRGMEPPAPPA